ncbi:uncharacterized protein EAE98_001878 [Botrytis deweyae]|uniref:Uncharacterized protein n=1 Tax=Botrytis deweyae TaxID=2478750 RepID=A0ABQ7IZ51_9HELO|nr:uncharacterized protein EAE98_001878 [Botrytis deweyae]KAF7937564.1 hypothetical protein EAE98_001878 [Botrytis deweyae]
MDTTLITFMFQATPRTQSVHLIGSWDNFTKRYPMERDSRRSREQWRGCHTFDDIICDGDGNGSSKRTGGLKMASTYYYYYELDDGIEVHDTAIPSTTTCPYMPGQPVNILWVPVEVSPPRLRSGSMDSINITEAKTMNPADKFMPPRAPPSKPNVARPASLSSSGAEVTEKPCPWAKDRKLGWATKLFSGRRSQPSSPIPPLASRRSSEPDISQATTRSSSSTNSNTIHQTSPTRFEPISRKSSFTRAHDSVHNSLMSLGIPEDISEDCEDDDNFATQFKELVFEDNDSITGLSPAPFRRQPSPTSNTYKPLPRLPDDAFTSPISFPPPPNLTLNLPMSHFSVSTASTALTSPTDSHFGFSDTSSIFDSYDESDLNEETGDTFTYNPMISEVEKRKFIGYSLPDEDIASEQTIRKASNPISKTNSNDSYPRDSGFANGIQESSAKIGGSALADFLEDMGYLGETIRDK